MLLNIHSYFSLRYGTLSLNDIVVNLKKNGYHTAVLTDIHNSTATLDFIKLCNEHEIKGIAGMEFTFDNETCFIGIAKNNEGFKELNEYQTALNFREIKPSKKAPDFKDVWVIYPYGKIDVVQLKENEFVGIKPQEVNKLLREPEDHFAKYVIWYPVTFSKEKYQLHLQLRAIEHNVLISQLSKKQVAQPKEFFISRKELENIYEAYPQIIENTEILLKQSEFQFDFKQNKNKQSFTNSKEEDRELLHYLTMKGFKKRYTETNEIAKKRVLNELTVINDLNFSSYFLITNDICAYARSQKYHYVGRGSGANSIVAYCLQITDVCPIELNLYFERFLNPKRQSPPDFDIDFSWNNRDAIYEYIFNRYPKGTVALMGAMSTFKSRSIIRELGKIYGLPKNDIDRLIRDPENILNKNEVTNTIQAVYNEMADFPNQRTIHASGVLISNNPLTYYTALDLPPKGLPTIQFDMYVAEAIGFEKFDILSQRGIGHINDCVELVYENKGEIISVENPRRFLSDPLISKQLKSANTIGCFYIESPAMRQLITKLECKDYLTLVAASSIIRPGVASSGMMQTFIERHRNPEAVTYLHPAFKEQLEDTYGVMVYQEDVMKIGHHFGGLDLADADVLRRMMSGKYRNKNHLLEIEDKFFSHCLNMGYPIEVSKEVWRQMESFAGYSFNKAHSASYAVESYQSLFLKTYYPLEFMVCVLNNYGGFYSRKVYLNETRKAGGVVCLPCVNNSNFNTRLYGAMVFLGFDCLLHFETKFASTLINERNKNGVYKSLEDFIFRTKASIEQLIILIRCGAFSFLNQNKKALLWQAHLITSHYKKEHLNVPLLFENSTRNVLLPQLETSFLEDLYDEIELIGFPISGTMFDLAKSEFRGITAKELVNFEGKTVRMVLDLVADKNVWTKSNKLMKFGTFLDLNGDFVDTVHFPPSLLHSPLKGYGLYLVEGKVQIEYNVPAIEVHRCARMPLKFDPRSE